MVKTNPLLKNASGLWKIWFTTNPVDHIPITLSAFWLEYQLWGSNPAGYHVVTVITHAISAVLLWRVFVRLRIPGAWPAAAVFAIHPVCVATVAWISEQKNTWALLFYLLTLHCFLSFDDRVAGAAIQRRKWYVLALIVFVCALWCKGSVVVLGPILLLVIWWRRRCVTKRDILAVLPFFMLGFGEGLLTIWFQNHNAINDGLVARPEFLERLAAAGWVFWFYLLKSWWPLNLMAIYPQWHIDPRAWTSYVPDAALIAVFVLAWSYRKKWGRSVLFGLGAFSVSLFPVLGFFRMSFQAYSRVADHLQYLALPCSVALAIGGAVYCLEMFKNRLRLPRLIGPVTALCLIALICVVSQSRLSVYQTDASLWRDAVKKNPDSWVSQTSLGMVYVAQNQFQMARDAFARVLKARPDYKNAMVGMGQALDGLGDHDAADKYYEEALQINPSFVMAWNSWGMNLVSRRRFNDARHAFESALQYQPDNPEVLQNLGALYDETGDGDHALAYFEKAAAVDPAFVGLLDRYGNDLVSEGKIDQGIVALRSARRLNPKDVSVLEHLSNALVQKGEIDEALKLGRTNQAVIPMRNPSGQ